ncbi:MAG: hypothetical protein JAY68_06450 [Candidatus Thiodiazotropha taylori]|nr:hypothetical protein [Candidatus Thiodiazotropha taylori]
MIGREGNYLFVNSAQAWSRSIVDDAFPCVGFNCPDGAVPLSQIIDGINSVEPGLPPDDVIVGTIANREVLKNVLYTFSGREYSKRHLRRLLDQADYIHEVTLRNGAKLDYSCVSSHENYASQYIKDIKLKRQRALEIARKKIGGN